MKRIERITVAVIVMIGVFLFFGCAVTTTGTKDDTAAARAGDGTDAARLAYVKDIAFETVKGKERVTISVTGEPAVKVSRASETTILVTLVRCFAPDDFRKRLGMGTLHNVRYVSAAQATTQDEQKALVTVSLLTMVPYRLKKEDGAVIIEFDTRTQQGRPVAGTEVPVPPSPSSSSAVTPSMARDILAEGGDTGGEDIVKYHGARMSISVQDAALRSVFRMISEVSGFSIVAQPAVQEQRVSLHMIDVPWDQVLDTVCEINRLGQKSSGKVITVLPVADLKKAEEEQLEKDATEGHLRQIAIEAKIVEVNTDFEQELGIRWGAGYQNTWGSKDYGVMLGNAASSSYTSTATLPGGIGLTSSNIAVNFPSAAAVATPALGLILGSSSLVLDAQLSALEAQGEGKIISSPKVMTLDKKKANIEQGLKIPYEKETSEGKSLDFIEALLSLDVTPTITREREISMKINATNDYPDWSRLVLGCPVIVQNNVESEVVLKDGDTIVLGGVYKKEENDSVSGVPGLSRIPILGWLFKYKTKKIETREILFFITPRILNEG